MDPWYGTIKVRQVGRGLAIDFSHSTGMEGSLTRYQYDTFKTNPALKWVEPAYVTSSIDPNGKVDRVTMKPASPRTDLAGTIRTWNSAPRRRRRIDLRVINILGSVVESVLVRQGLALQTRSVPFRA